MDPCQVCGGNGWLEDLTHDGTWIKHVLCPVCDGEGQKEEIYQPEYGGEA